MASLDRVGSSESLGTLLKRARLEAEMNFSQLSEATGITRGQLHRLENDQVKRINPAHLAVLAEPLEISLYDLYEAAGYPVQSALPNLGSKLEAKLCWLPPDAVERLEAYVDKLVLEHGITLEPDDEPAEA